MKQNLALLSVTMNTPLKIQEERIWSTWYRRLLGKQVYLVSNLSHVKGQKEHLKLEEIDHQETFENPGHIPGCCQGLQLGLDHLKKINFNGIVVLTVPDTIADEGFKDILTTGFDRQVYTHDWGPGHAAMDFVVLAPEVWRRYQLPKLLGYMGNTPVMQHGINKFPAPDRSPYLEQWHQSYLEKNWSHKIFNQSEHGAGWGTNVGTWFNLPDCKFRVVQSGGDARPTKTHTTDKYYEFDITGIRNEN